MLQKLVKLHLDESTLLVTQGSEKNFGARGRKWVERIQEHSRTPLTSVETLTLNYWLFINYRTSMKNKPMEGQLEMLIPTVNLNGLV